MFLLPSIHLLRVSALLSSSANYIDQSSSVTAWGASSVWWRLHGIPNLLAGVVNLDGAVPITASGRDGYRDLFARINREGFQPVVAQFIRQVFFLPFEHGAISEEIVTEMISHPEGLASALLK